MDQITAFFEGIDVDELMTVVTEYVTKIDVNKMMLDFGELVKAAFWTLLGGLVGSIVG